MKEKLMQLMKLVCDSGIFKPKMLEVKPFYDKEIKTPNENETFEPSVPFSELEHYSSTADFDRIEENMKRFYQYDKSAYTRGEANLQSCEDAPSTSFFRN